MDALKRNVTLSNRSGDAVDNQVYIGHQYFLFGLFELKKTWVWWLSGSRHLYLHDIKHQHAVNPNLWTAVPSASWEQMILLKLFNLVCETPPLHCLPPPPPIHRPLNLQCLWSSPRIQKSLNSFWQSLGRVSRGASSTELHTAGRIYYAEKKN